MNYRYEARARDLVVGDVFRRLGRVEALEVTGWSGRRAHCVEVKDLETEVEGRLASAVCVRLVEGSAGRGTRE